MALVWFWVECRSVELLEAGFKAKYGVGCECDAHEGRDLLWLDLGGGWKGHEWWDTLGKGWRA